MSTLEPVTIGDEIRWIDIEPDGREVDRTGIVWSKGPPLAGMRTFWAAPTDGRALPNACVRVCLASRRHQCGRALPPGGISRYYPNAGRWIDPGTLYSETDHRSRFTLNTVPPKYLRSRKRVDAAARNDMANYVRMLERVDRGEDVDFTVSVTDAARAADASGGTL